LLTGRRAFAGDTVSGTIAAIHGQEPDWERLPANTPQLVRRLLRRCLEKDPDRRLRDMGDARIEIEDALSEGRRPGSEPDVGAALPGKASRVGRWLGGVAVVVLVAAGAIWVSRWVSPPPAGAPAPVTRLTISPPAGMTFAFSSPQVSPDGSTVVFGAGPAEGGDPQAVPALYAQRLDEFEPTKIEGSERAALPLFSPDGRWLAFAVPVAAGSQKLQFVKVPVGGGAPPARIADVPKGTTCCTDWLPGGDLVMLTGKERERRRSLVRIPTDGRPPPPPVEVEFPQDVYILRIMSGARLPDGRHLLAFAIRSSDRGDLHSTLLLDVETGRLEPLIEDGILASWIPTGHLLFVQHNTLLAVPFDAATRELRGAPIAITDDLLTGSGSALGQYSISEGGTLVYPPGGLRHAGRTIVIATQEELRKPALLRQFETWSGPHNPPFQHSAQVSDDGRQFAVVVTNFERRGNLEIWASPFDGRPRLRAFAAMDGAVDCFAPVWSPDGDRLVYRCVNRPESEGIYLKPLEGTGEPERILEGAGSPVRFTPDGLQLLVAREGDLLLLPLEKNSDGVREPRLLVRGIAFQRPFSADGRWMAYQDTESGRRDLVIRRWSGNGFVGPRVPVTTEEGNELDWVPGESAVAYSSSDGTWKKVSIVTEPELVISEPETLFDAKGLHWASGEWLPDGRIIAVAQAPVEYEAPRLLVIRNWFEELEQKLAEGG